MSNIYIQEPPTEGKVLITTTAGEFDIELWSKEAPKAVRNFVQLCLENYYDGTIFHRVIPGFIVQGGDPQGTGTGGESIYGKPFRDEFHSRLRFVRRGLLAMANSAPNDNGSQFFFTLGACPELQNKHTIFAKLSGKTQYNLSRFEEGEIEGDDRPVYPYKVVKTEVLSNPFPDIEPRHKIENEIPREQRKKKKKGTKNFKLLSFGDEAEVEEEEVVAVTRSLMGSHGSSAHDIAQDPTLSSLTEHKDHTTIVDRIRKKLKTSQTSETVESEVLHDNSTNNKVPDQNTIKDSSLKDSSPSQEEEEKEKLNDKLIKDNSEQIKVDKLAEMKAENKRLMREVAGKEPKIDKIDKLDIKSNEETDVVKQYNEERAIYSNIKSSQPKKGKEREQLTLAALTRFNKKMKNFLDASDDEAQDNEKPDNEIDDDDDWLQQKLSFKDEVGPVVARDASTKNDSWYDVNDPRNAIAKRRRDDRPTSKKKS